MSDRSGHSGETLRASAVLGPKVCLKVGKNRCPCCVWSLPVSPRCQNESCFESFGGRLWSAGRAGFSSTYFCPRMAWVYQLWSISLLDIQILFTPSNELNF
ncbi:unnamed protein product, partial [Ectocarpus sp. 12 AP-2014]